MSLPFKIYTSYSKAIWIQENNSFRKYIKHFTVILCSPMFPSSHRKKKKTLYLLLPHGNPELRKLPYLTHTHTHTLYFVLKKALKFVAPPQCIHMVAITPHRTIYFKP